jgi:hypothetical protein
MKQFMLLWYCVFFWLKAADNASQPISIFRSVSILANVSKPGN